jgi:hypothetical protein
MHCLFAQLQGGKMYGFFSKIKKKTNMSNLVKKKYIELQLQL